MVNTHPTYSLPGSTWTRVLTKYPDLSQEINISTEANRAKRTSTQCLQVRSEESTRQPLISLRQSCRWPRPNWWTLAAPMPSLKKPKTVLRMKETKHLTKLINLLNCLECVTPKLMKVSKEYWSWLRGARSRKNLEKCWLRRHRRQRKLTRTKLQPLTKKSWGSKTWRWGE